MPTCAPSISPRGWLTCNWTKPPIGWQLLRVLRLTPLPSWLEPSPGKPATRPPAWAASSPTSWAWARNRSLRLRRARRPPPRLRRHRRPRKRKKDFSAKLWESLKTTNPRPTRPNHRTAGPRNPTRGWRGRRPQTPGGLGWPGADSAPRGRSYARSQLFLAAVAGSDLGRRGLRGRRTEARSSPGGSVSGSRHRATFGERNPRGAGNQRGRTQGGEAVSRCH